MRKKDFSQFSVLPFYQFLPTAAIRVPKILKLQKLERTNRERPESIPTRAKEQKKAKKAALRLAWTEPTMKFEKEFASFCLSTANLPLSLVPWKTSTRKPFPRSASKFTFQMGRNWVPPNLSTQRSAKKLKSSCRQQIRHSPGGKPTPRRVHPSINPGLN